MLKELLTLEKREEVWSEIQKEVVRQAANTESVEDLVDVTTYAVAQKTSVTIQDVLFTWAVMQIQIAMTNQAIAAGAQTDLDAVEPGGMPPNGRHG